MAASIQDSALALLIVAPSTAERTNLVELAGKVGVGRVDVVDNAIEAYGRLAILRPTLALVDSQLRPTDGLTFVREIRAAPIPNADAPIYLLTRDDPAIVRYMAEHAGADGALKLPLSEPDLLDALARKPSEKRAPTAAALQDYAGPDRRLDDPLPYVGHDRRGAGKPLSAAAARVHGLIDNLLKEAEAGMAARARSALDPDLVAVESALDRAAQLAVKIGDARLLSALTKTLVAIDAARGAWSGDDGDVAAAIENARRHLSPAVSVNAKF